jgi:hypothetical protein
LILRFGPRRERRENIFTVQDHQVIAFGEDDQTRWRTEATDDVGNRVGMAGESSHLRRHLDHDGPHERFK